MMEAILVVQNSDQIDRVIETALEVVKCPGIKTVVFHFNEVKIFVGKTSSFHQIMQTYKEKIKNA